MEAISDDEDLPDLPPETGDVEEEYQPDDCMDEIGMDENHPDEGEDVEGFGYEEIISDEEDLPEYQYEEEWLVDEWEDWLKPFSPNQFQMFELQYLVSPTLTDYQVEYQRWKARFEMEGPDLEEEPNQAIKLENLLSETTIPVLAAEENVVETETGEAREEEGEKWVQAMEHVCQLLPKGLPFLVAKSGTDVVNSLCDWVDIGLDFERALGQEQPVYKIRHVKAGVRLTQLMLQCSSDVTDILLNRNIMNKLYTLYHKPHMALSIKLLILKTIDTITRTSLGLRFFLGKSEDLSEGQSEKNGYEVVLEMLSDVPQTRAKVALSAIIRKVHLLDVCHQLSENTNRLVKHLPPIEEDTKCKEELNPDDDSMEADEAEGRIDLPSNWSTNIPDSLVQAINSCVREILRVYKYADQLLAQPHRWLPGSKQFQLPKNPHDPYPQLYLLLDHGDLLQSLAILLGALGAVQNGVLVADIKSLLECLLSFGHGIKYMAAHPESSTTIARSLTQLGEDGREEGNEDTSLHQLGMQMVHTFHALQQLDSLAQLATTHNTDYSQAVVHFNALTSLLLSLAGRHAVTSLLSVGNNIEILFAYLKLGAGDDQDNAPTRLACYGYAVDLIVLTVKFSENVEMLEQYGGKLLELIDYEEIREGPKLDEHAKLCEIIPWISIARSSENFTYDNLANLSNSLKDQLEKIDKFSGELVTHLRIIQYLTVPKYPVSNLAPEDHNGELIEELKYKYATVQLFAADCHTHLTNLLTKLCSMYSQPSVYSSNFTCSEGAILLAVIQPTLILLKNILTYVIQARNTNFKDLSAIVPLVQMYLLLQSFPLGSQHYNQSQELQQEIISILLVYTQPVYSKAEGEEVLAKSLWTKMMAEVFKYLLSSPHTFMGVISLIIELLPLPLPLQTRTALSEEESSQIINLRKLWSAHLYCLSPNIHEIIMRLGLTSFPPLMHLLRRMCIALSDLAAPMALLVGRATLDLVLQAHRLDQRASGEDFGPCSLQTGRVLNMLALLVSHAPTKAAVLHLLRGGSPTLAINAAKGEDKYTGLVALWCRILNVAASGSHAHMQAQDCIITIIQYLCDHENAMHVPQDSSVQEGEAQSTAPTMLTLSGVPNKDTLIPIVDALIDHLRNLHSSHQSIQQVLRALMHLMEHDYGFYHIKSVMEKKKACLISLFKRLTSTFRKESHEHLMSLQGALEFCELLIMNDDSSMSRTMIVSASELANYLGWKPGGYEMQFSKYSQDKKDTLKKEEREKEKEKEREKEKVVKEEPVEEHRQEKEELPDKENDVEGKQEDVHTTEEKDEVKMDEVKIDEVREDEEKMDEVRIDEVKMDEVKMDEVKMDEIKVDEVKVDEVKKDEVKDEVKKEEVKMDDAKMDEVKMDEAKMDEAKKDKAKRDKAKKGEAKKDEVKKDEAKKDEANKDEAKKDKAKKDEAEKDEAKKDEAKKDEAKKDEAKNDEANKDEAKKDKAKKDEVKKDEVKKDEVKKDEIKKDEIKKEDIKREEPRKEEETQERIHPLKLLEKQVIAECCEEEVMETLYDDISQLISMLDQACPFEVKELSEPVGPEMETLQSLFASRVVWTIAAADDDIPSFWLVPPLYEDADPLEMVPTNLLETCHQYAGEYDLLGTLHKLVKGQGSQALTPQKLCKGPPRYKHSAGAIRPDKRGRPFVAPMRGRSFNRGMNMRSDPFRSRPPNTSRPPSLHVDDFVALESTGHQPTGPTGYNKISFGRGKFLLDSMRGRGNRGRGDSRGSRFFHRPPFRPDCGVVRGMNPRGRGMPWIFRGDGSPRGYRGVPLNPGTMRFMRGRGMYMRGNGVGNGPKDRFPSKFVERGGRREMNGGRHMRGGFR
nr:protein virilizer homolog [Procambarus clarkii]